MIVNPISGRSRSAARQLVAALTAPEGHGPHLDNVGDHMEAAAALHHEVQKRLGRIDQVYTRGRQVIVAALVDAGLPITIPELLQRAPKLTQSSAYRNLAMMEAAGVVRRLVHSVEHAHYELAEDLTEHHHHLICRRCGLVRDITLDKRLEQALDAAFHRLAASDGFRSDHHLIDVYGVCAECGPP